MVDHSRELERLIADARQAGPDPAAERRVAAGVAGAVGGVAPPAGPGGSTVLAAAAKLTVLAVTLGGVLWWGLRPAPMPAAPISTPTVPLRAPVIERPPTVSAEPAAPPSVASAPRAPVVRGLAPLHAGASDAASPVARVPEAQASEWQLVRRARETLDKDPSASLRFAAAHARLYPHGALAQEREVIVIDALMRLGRGQDAKARAEALLRQSPETVHRAHIEALLARRAP